MNCFYSSIRLSVKSFHGKSIFIESAEKSWKIRIDSPTGNLVICCLYSQNKTQKIFRNWFFEMLTSTVDLRSFAENCMYKDRSPNLISYQCIWCYLHYAQSIINFPTWYADIMRKVKIFPQAELRVLENFRKNA